MTRLLCLSALICWSCVDNAGGRDRQGAAADAGASVTDGTSSPTLDAQIMDAAPEPTDGEPETAADTTPPAPDAADIPEECNGVDEDGDGRVDEGVANACGGCGGIPPGGCEAWSVNLVQDGEALLDPGRIVFLAARILGSSSFETTNARCDQVRIALTPDPDRHLGAVDITSPLTSLALVPGVHPATEQVVYDTGPASEPVQVHRSGDLVRVQASGGEGAGPFDTDLVAPDTLTEVEPEDLEPWIAAARGAESEGPLSLSWGAGSGDIRLYVGGSKLVFGLTAFYRGIEHYVLNLALEDTGELSLPGDLFGAGSPESATWAYLARTRTQRIPLDQHAVALEIGQRVELRANGGADEAEMPPFQITSPSPNDRQVEAGVGLPVQWGQLPTGPGPLSVQLVFRNSALGEQHVVTCEVEDPTAGAMEIPAEVMAAWPDGDDFRQLSLRWTRFSQIIDSVDEGELTRATTMILRLDR